MIRSSDKKLKILFTLLFAIQVLAINLFSQQESLTWLGTLGGNLSQAFAVSDDGSVIVGVSTDGNGAYRAFRWTTASGIQNLGTLGGAESRATGVSADGSIIVGWSYDSSSVFRSFKWTVTDGMQDFGAGEFSKATGISNDGTTIVGFRYESSIQKAYRFKTGSGYEDLGSFGKDAGASGVSSNGSIVVGYSSDSLDDKYAFRWIEGTGIVKIGTYYSFASGVSGDGNTITGFETGSAGLYKAFRWTSSGIELNIVGNFSEGLDVSYDGGYIVGYASGGAFRLSQSNNLEILNQTYSSLLTSGSDLYTASAISSNGRFVVGYGLNSATNRSEAYLLDTGSPTSIEFNEVQPVKFSLEQNYPNPFNPSTKISWQSPVGSHQTLKVYDVLGNEVATLVDEYKPAGTYEVEFEASQLSSGIYFYRLQSGDYVLMRKMILLK